MEVTEYDIVRFLNTLYEFVMTYNYSEEQLKRIGKAYKEVKELIDDQISRKLLKSYNEFLRLIMDIIVGTISLFEERSKDKMDTNDLLQAIARQIAVIAVENGMNISELINTANAVMSLLEEKSNSTYYI